VTTALTRVDPRDKNVVAAWDDAHHYSPAPRHRRRLILEILERLAFDDVLDAGCAQPYLLSEIVQRFGVAGFGCDLSDQVVDHNRMSLPGCEFQTIDLTTERWPGGRKFDLVVCSEVLEHIENWLDALGSIVAMAHKYILITVPGGPLRAMDRQVGHVRHFTGPDLAGALEGLSCQVLREESWGWPLHSAYKAAISALAPEKVYKAFSGGRPYGPGKKAVSEVLYRSFFINDLVGFGHQRFVLARVPQPAPEPRRKRTTRGCDLVGSWSWGEAQ
jgi:SAM-dependent methyltransferase